MGIIRRPKRSEWLRLVMKVVLWLAILTLVVAEISWFLHREVFLIREVQISGATPGLTERLRTIVDQELAGDYLGLIPRAGLWFYPKQYLLWKLTQDLPEISKLRLERTAGKVLAISVQERNAAFIWCDTVGANCYTLDETGFAFAPAPQFSGHPFFELYGQTIAKPLGLRPLAPELFNRAIGLQSGLNKVLADSSLPFQAYRLSLDGSTTWVFRLRSQGADEVGDVTLLTDSQQAPESVLVNLHSMLAAPAFIKEYQTNMVAGHSLAHLDLRFPNRIVYKFK